MLNKTFKEYILEKFAFTNPHGCYETIMTYQKHFDIYYQHYKNDGGTEIVTFKGIPVKQRRILNAA